MLLHDLPDFSDLIEVAARNEQIDPSLVEKDHWIMHCLWGLQQGGFTFELKGGTSLSKGYGLIDRFSEDVDILIHPDTDLKYGPNHTRAAHIAARLAFFEGLTKSIEIPGIASVERDTAFDDTRYYRGAGIRLRYKSIHPLPDGLKEGILLEAGFDQVAPNRPARFHPGRMILLSRTRLPNSSTIVRSTYRVTNQVTRSSKSYRRFRPITVCNRQRVRCR